MDQEQDLSTKGPGEIRHQIERTRESLSRKLDTLEYEVKETVDDAKSSVKHTVDGVKQSVSIRYQVARRPWSFVGGSVAVGLILGKLITGRNQGAASPPAPTTSAWESHRKRVDSGRSVFGALADQFEEEIHGAKEMAIGAVMSTIREVAKEALPNSLSSKVGELIDSATQKLGGEPIRGRVIEH